MEYEVQVERDQNGRVIVDFYGLDFDITNEFVNGKCHKVIFGDPIVFVLKNETKEEPVENSNTAEETPETHGEVPESEHPEEYDEVAEEPEKHEESEHPEEVIEYSPVEEHSTEDADNHVGASEETHAEEKPVENSEEPVIAPEEEHTPVEPGAETEETPKEN
nr:MAG TPA: hypothetical protein [Caudoviricetes sp.]